MSASAINLLTGAQGGAVTGTGSAGATASLSDNFDNFLTLLTTQLQYQDPLSPMDANEFTSQLVQFSQVEQSIATNKNLEAMIALQQAGQSVAAVGYLGKSIEALGDTAPLAESTATWNYALAKEASVNILRIVDSTGKTVKILAGDTDPGKHTFVWDGKDDNGIQMPDGIYRLIVAPQDLDGEPMETATSFAGTVSSVATVDGQITLDVQGVGITLDKLLIINQPPAADDSA